MQQISPVALPVCRSKLLLRLVMSIIRKQDATCDRWQCIKPCPWNAVNKLMKASWQKATTFDCKKPMSSTKYEWILVHNVRLKHTAAVSHPVGQVCGRVDPASPGPPVLQSWGPSETHHSFLYAPVPTFPSAGKERLWPKRKANLRSISLHKYLGSVFLTQRITDISIYENNS